MSSQPYTPPNQGKTLAEKAWDELDAALDWLSRVSETDQAAQHWEALGRCRALAWTIHTWTPHWYKDVDAVTHHAVKRRKMRLGELEWEPTPGYKYNPMPPSKEPRRRETHRPRPLPFTPLSDNEKAAIKHALDNGMRVDTLASVYGVTERQIKELE